MHVLDTHTSVEFTPGFPRIQQSHAVPLGEMEKKRQIIAQGFPHITKLGSILQRDS